MLRRSPRIPRASLLVAVLLVGGPALPSLGASPAGDLERTLARFDAAQRGVQSISAAFTMTTESALLTDRIVARGQIYLTKPDAVRWEFSSPEEMRFVIADNLYTGYFPAQKRAERRDIQRWREHLFRFLGLGQASGELSKFYEISLAKPGPADAGLECLLLEPKKRRVRKKVESVRLCVDGSSYLPVRVEYSTKSGDRRVIEFEEMAVNPVLAAGLYTVELPPDVVVTNGFSGFGSFGAAAH
jgi:outer membrane lipoprotein-sorting protein